MKSRRWHDFKNGRRVRHDVRPHLSRFQSEQWPTGGAQVPKILPFSRTVKSQRKWLASSLEPQVMIRDQGSLLRSAQDRTRNSLSLISKTLRMRRLVSSLLSNNSEWRCHLDSHPHRRASRNSSRCAIVTRLEIRKDWVTKQLPTKVGKGQIRLQSSKRRTKVGTWNSSWLSP